MDKHITYLLPSKNRPSKFNDCLTDIFTLSVSNNYEVIAVLNEDDKDLENYKSIIKEFSGMRVGLILSLIKTKIEACNVAVPLIKTETDIVVLYSDDFRLLKKGFDNDIREAYADGFKGLVHFPDGRVENEPQKKHAVNFQIWILKNGLVAQPNGTWSNGRWKYDNLALMYDAYFLESKQRLVTFPIMHVEYLKIDGWIYHPRFLSVCSDDLQTELAKKRGKYKYVDKNIMVHEHYRNGFGPPDLLMQHNDSGDFYKHDRAILDELRVEFGL